MQKTDFSHLYTEEEKARFAWCRGQLEGLSCRPLISIVVPVYRTPVRLLDEMISSVVGQIYPDWELCIANASPEDMALCARLTKWQAADERIRVKTLEQNRGISANTNECFGMVRGEYTAMLDHDDLLTENALFEVVWCLQEHPELDFLYSDQDMLDEESKGRFNPLYKPQWSKDMMYSGNYITHFSVLHTALIQEIGGWNPGTDGAQDWDLFLKAAEHTAHIRGIPQILYHWRMARTSTASSMDTKTYALEAQLRSLREHLSRIGEGQAEVEFSNRDIFKIQVHWNRSHEEDISVILLDEGHSPDLRLTVAMLRVGLDLKEKEIFVVSDSEERLRELEGSDIYRCTCIHKAYKTWAEGYNAGAVRAGGEILLFCTDQVRSLEPDTFLELADWAVHDKVAAAGPKIAGEDRVIREMGVALTEDGPKPMFEGCFTDGTTDSGKNYWYRNVHAVDHNCFAVRRSFHEEAGGFREETGELAMLSYCLALEEKGYRHVVTPFAVVACADTMCSRIHREAEEAGREFVNQRLLPSSDAYYRRK